VRAIVFSEGVHWRRERNRRRESRLLLSSPCQWKRYPRKDSKTKNKGRKETVKDSEAPHRIYGAERRNSSGTCSSSTSHSAHVFHAFEHQAESQRLRQGKRAALHASLRRNCNVHLPGTGRSHDLAPACAGPDSDRSNVLQ
jgi:hypothetical protein